MIKQRLIFFSGTQIRDRITMKTRRRTTCRKFALQQMIVGLKSVGGCSTHDTAVYDATRPMATSSGSGASGPAAPS